jgi:predicted nucleic acid-binding protein
LSYLLDANILLYIANENDPHHEIATQAVAGLLAAGETVVIVPQVFYEYWTVATRAAVRGGLAMTIEEAVQEVAGIQARFPHSRQPLHFHSDSDQEPGTISQTGSTTEGVRVPMPPGLRTTPFMNQ